MGRVLVALFLVSACAEGSAITGGSAADGGAGAGGDGRGGDGRGGESSTDGGAGVGAGSAAGGAGAAGGAPAPDLCPVGEVASGVDGAGKLTCVAPATLVAAAVDASCSVYLGARDGCGGCSDPPTKWGLSTGLGCMVGAGVDNTCGSHLLGGVTRPLFGLNTDGDVDDNDKLHVALECAADGTPGGCEPGDVLVGWDGVTATCRSAAAVVSEVVGAQCAVFFGWRDDCGACADPPSRWGRVTSGGCTTSGAAGDTCVETALGSATVSLYGLRTGGDVDGNDKFYVGLSCAAPTPSQPTTASVICGPGQVVSGVAPSGELTCESPAAAIVAAAQTGCSLTLGWLDGCDGCTTPPSKWGVVGHGTCVNGAGLDNTCASVVLGADTVSLFGLSTDGDVNDDDKFFLGLQCE
jgi:hypothetical protein